MDDTETLLTLNDRFIEAFRLGSWATLEPILAPSFRYLDGATGELWDLERYRDALDGKASPGLAIDQVVVHTAGDTAIVSARSSRRPGRYSRYVDTYERRDGGWACVHACVWPLHETSSPDGGASA